jgi:putative ABC transport system permease protein
MSLIASLGALEIGLIFGLVALGVFLSFRVINFPDLTVDGSFPLGGAVAAALIVAGWNPFAATAVAIAAGALAGALTAWLNVHLRIMQLLASILVMIALYSVNLRVMGKPTSRWIDDLRCPVWSRSTACPVSAGSRRTAGHRRRGQAAARPALPRGRPGMRARRQPARGAQVISTDRDAGRGAVECAVSSPARRCRRRAAPTSRWRRQDRHGLAAVIIGETAGTQPRPDDAGVHLGAVLPLHAAALNTDFPGLAQDSTSHRVLVALALLVPGYKRKLAGLMPRRGPLSTPIHKEAR